MIIDIEKYIEFLSKNKLTQAQFLFLFCLYKKKFKLIKQYQSMYPTPDGTTIGKLMFEDLIERGFIEQVGAKTTADNFKVTKKFHQVFVDKLQASRELQDTYPLYKLSNNVKYSMGGMNEDLLKEVYYQKIAGSVDEHEEVIKDVQYAKEHNLIMVNLEKFVNSRGWIGIREERLLKEGKTDVVDIQDTDL